MSQPIRPIRTSPSDLDSLTIVSGRVSYIDADGSCFVSVSDADEPVRAQIVASEAAGLSEDTEVLLAIGGARGPVVIGPIVDSIFERESSVERHVSLEAGESVTIKCGASSITMRQDGTVVIKGEDLITRARRQNKIRGATVKIN